MSRHILLDSSPLGLLSKPTSGTQILPVTHWATACLAAGHRVYMPEVIDCELRRELIRAGKSASLTRLDGLKLLFIPLCPDHDGCHDASRFVNADLWSNIAP